MPIINHASQPVTRSEEFATLRSLVTKEHGSVGLTINEVTLTPGMARPLQSHPVDIAFMMLEGSLQMIVGDEVRTVRAGNTLLAPPGTPYKLINNTWVAARMLMIFPADSLETKILE